MTIKQLRQQLEQAGMNPSEIDQALSAFNNELSDADLERVAAGKGGSANGAARGAAVGAVSGALGVPLWGGYRGYGYRGWGGYRGWNGFRLW